MINKYFILKRLSSIRINFLHQTNKVNPLLNSMLFQIYSILKHLV